MIGLDDAGLIAENERLRAEVERLRARTHEIQAQEMSKRAALDRRLAAWSNMFDYAARWIDDDAWWRHTSYRDRAVIHRALIERGRALAVLAALCRGQAARPEHREQDERKTP